MESAGRRPANGSGRRMQLPRRREFMAKRVERRRSRYASRFTRSANSVSHSNTVSRRRERVRRHDWRITYNTTTTLLLPWLLLLSLFNIIPCPFFLLFSFRFFFPSCHFVLFTNGYLTARARQATADHDSYLQAKQPSRPTTRLHCVIIVFSLRRYVTRYFAMRTSSEPHEGHLTASRHPPLAR